MEAATTTGRDISPKRAGLVLAALILIAAVANLNLAVANVAWPSIGKDLDASQTALDLIAVGYSLGLAASALYLGAIGDRYGRKLMLVPQVNRDDEEHSADHGLLGSQHREPVAQLKLLHNVWMHERGAGRSTSSFAGSYEAEVAR